MSTETRVIVNGRPAEDLEAALQAAPADRYLIVKDGKPVEAVMWDGASPFDPGDGAELHREADWKGAAYTGPQEPEADRRRRTARERLDVLTERVSEDIRGWADMTAAQRNAATLRGLRLLRAIARELRDDIRDDEAA